MFNLFIHALFKKNENKSTADVSYRDGSGGVWEVQNFLFNVLIGLNV